ncbi:MAG: histidinol-phosphate transaminase [Miltoncostaeaceae bacterium]
MSDAPHLDPALIRPSLASVQPYVPGRPLAELRRELGDVPITKLASNEGPYPPFPLAVDAIQRAAAEQNLYPDPGAWGVRDALAERHGIPAERIVVGNGMDSLIKVLCMTFLDPGDEIVMCWPSFVSYRQGATVEAATWTPVPLDPGGAYDLDALAAAVTPATKIVVVVSPNNPTGGVVDDADLRRFLDTLPPHVLPVLDEAYFEYLPPGSHDGMALLREGRCLVVMRTFSKAYGLAGLRVGWMAGPEGIAEAMSPVRNAFDVNAVAQAAAVASLEDAPAHLPQRIAEASAERQRMTEGLRALGLMPLPSSANFLFIDVGDDEAKAIDAALTRRGVIVRPTAGFGAHGGLRITVGLPEQTDRLLGAMAEALQEIR